MSRPMSAAAVPVYDAIIVGSGFGGAMTAQVLVRAGWRVLLLERGPWVRRDASRWEPGQSGLLSPYYSKEDPYRVVEHRRERTSGAFFCVGGASVFYGGASLRFRERDFVATPEFHGDARWPVGYAELERHYSEAEQLLGICGEPNGDPTAPPRSAPYGAPPAPLAPISARLFESARALGWSPFRVPVAMDQRVRRGAARCVSCDACDGFACPIAAKNDLATVVLAPLIGQGLELRPNTVVTRLVAEGGVVTAVETADAVTSERKTFRGRQVILAAGALATPHLILASGLERYSTAPHAVGRYLMRHHNTVVVGLFPSPPNAGHLFLKQVAVHDFYHGDPAAPHLGDRLGALQQLALPPASVVRAMVPRLLGWLATPVIDHCAAMLALAEDQPCLENGVQLRREAPDRYGMPGLLVHHKYTRRDQEAGRRLAGQAVRLLHAAGAVACVRHVISTFSHALGTVRMGVDPASSPLDQAGRFRGLANLVIADGSAIPTSAGVNPSLTIAANALRIARTLAAQTSHEEIHHAA
jgi:choline dehydrogenase-like flavoprotein